MARIITAVLALVAISFFARRALTPSAPATVVQAVAPTPPNVGPTQAHGIAHRIEAADQKYVDEVEKKTSGE